LLNNYRVQNGALPLLIDPDIAEAADWMSTDMGVNDYFSHTDSLGQSPWTRMCNFGYCWNTWKGENLAAGYTTGATVFEGWRNSSGHNANMLNANFKVMGLARVYTAGSTYGWYWTNDFGGHIAQPTVTPSPGATPTPVPSPTASPTPVPTPTASPTAVPTPTPSPSPTTQPLLCSNDADCDGWTDSREAFLGTNTVAACSSTGTINDEIPDAWPPDFNDDKKTDTIDSAFFAGKLNSVAGGPAYSPRADLNQDLRVNTIDVGMMLPLNRPCN
jgi:hypothetical protein